MSKGYEMLSSQDSHHDSFVNSNSRKGTTFNCAEEEHEREIFINEGFENLTFRVGGGDNKTVNLAFPKDLFTGLFANGIR